MQKETLIVGGGLVGSILACYLSKRGYPVKVYERRPDWRKTGFVGGRSINLALSDRGWMALERIGLRETVAKMGIPMRGRMVHQTDGTTRFLPYGDGEQSIYSVSRGELNRVLVDEAEKKYGVNFHFDRKCTGLNLEKNIATFEHEPSGTREEVSAGVIFGADGAYSEVRGEMLKRVFNFSYSQQYESHGYKELSIPPHADGSHRIDPNALHIWPRESFMMIALPNLDGSFTCTLFAPFEGEEGLFALNAPDKIQAYFDRYFRDAVPHMPALIEEFQKNPNSSLMTVKCFPWKSGNTCLIGDAAHAVVPFYGQGMNCGFEDVRVLDDLLQENSDWNSVLNQFQHSRKPNADAIADLAVYNFVEMRDLSGRADFQLRMQLEKHLANAFPGRFRTLYSMVTFSPNTGYAEAKNQSKKQDQILDEIMAMDNIASVWNTEVVLQKVSDWLDRQKR